MPIVEKEFVLKNVFKDVSNMNHTDRKDSKIEEHFGIPWCISVQRNENHLGLYLRCEKEKQEKEWSIEVSYETKMNSVNGKTISRRIEYIFQHTNESIGRGWPQFVKWEDMIKDYAIDDTLSVEIDVKIKKMTGIEKKNLMNFDESAKEFSDVVLIVEDQKFHVLKLFLARQSTYFEALFLRNFEESKKEEIPLSDIDSNDFQNFLELLHGESPIDETTIEGILHLADMYDAKIAIRKCEQFLMENSEKSLKEKLKLAHRYHLNNLKDYCLSKINTVADIRSVIADDFGEMDSLVLGALLQKSLSLHTTN